MIINDPGVRVNDEVRAHRKDRSRTGGREGRNRVPYRSVPHRTGNIQTRTCCLASAAALLACGLLAVPAGAGTRAAADQDHRGATREPVAVGRADTRVTLPTGESVQVSRSTGGEPRVMLEGSDGLTAAAVHGIGDKVYVLPLGTGADRGGDGHDLEDFEVTGPADDALGVSTAGGTAEDRPARGTTPLVTGSNGTATASTGTDLQDVEVTLLDRQGARAMKYWDFSALRVAGDYSQCVTTQPDANGTAHFRLAPGTWIFYGEIYTTNGDRKEIVQYLRTGVRIGGGTSNATGEAAEPLELVLDGRATVRADLDVSGLGRTHDQGSVHGFSWRRGGMTASAYVTATEGTDVYLTPAPAVAEEGLAFTQAVSRRRSDATVVLPGPSGRTPLDLDMVVPDDRIQGTSTVRIVPVSVSDTAEEPLPAVSLALARVGGPDGFASGDDALAAARSRGARGAVLWSAVGEGGRLRPENTPQLPVLTPVEGPAFAAAVGTGVVGAGLTVDQWGHPAVGLARHLVGGIPNELDVTYPRSRLARVRQVFHSQPDVTTGRDVRWSAQGVSFDTRRFVKFGTVRTDYLSPDSLWKDAVYRCQSGWSRGAWYSVGSREFPVGPVSVQNWGGPVQRSSVLPDERNNWVLRLLGTYVSGYVSYWTDGAGHPSSPGTGEKGSWRIASGETVVGAGDRDGVQGSIAEGRHLYRLSHDVVRPTARGGDAGGVSTVWTFPAEPNDAVGDPDYPWDGEIVPMLDAVPRIPVGPGGTVRPGSTISFDVDGTVVGAGPAELGSVKVWTWADGTPENARTEARAVRRIDADTFRVTLTNPRAPAGTGVGLRIVATGANDLAIDQTVRTAYTLG